jgi:hypothetical protein
MMVVKFILPKKSNRTYPHLINSANYYNKYQGLDQTPKKIQNPPQRYNYFFNLPKLFIHIYKIKCGKVYLAVLLRARIFVVLLGDRQHRSLNYLLNIKIKHLWLITN